MFVAKIKPDEKLDESKWTCHTFEAVSHRYREAYWMKELKLEWYDDLKGFYGFNGNWQILNKILDRKYWLRREQNPQKALWLNRDYKILVTLDWRSDRELFIPYCRSAKYQYFGFEIWYRKASKPNEEDLTLLDNLLSNIREAKPKKQCKDDQREWNKFSLDSQYEFDYTDVEDFALKDILLKYPKLETTGMHFYLSPSSTEFDFFVKDPNNE